METLGLKNINMLTKEQFDGVENPALDELYAVSSSGFGKPSSKYVDLTLGASGAQYTAPANGYFYCNMVTGATNLIYFSVVNITTGITKQVWAVGGQTTNTHHILSECRKGDKVQINYNFTGAKNLKFYFDEGEI